MSISGCAALLAAGAVGCGAAAAGGALTATGGVDAAGGALCPMPPRLTDDSRDEAGGALNQKSVMKCSHGKSRLQGTHERQLAAQQRAVAASRRLLEALLREEH